MDGKSPLTQWAPWGVAIEAGTTAGAAIAAAACEDHREKAR